MQVLDKIQEDIQKVIEPMASLLNLDIEVIDSSLTRVCATGKLKSMVGDKVALGGMVHDMLIKKSSYIGFVMNPGNEEVCYGCSLISSCKYKKAALKPLVYDGEIIGVLGISAFDSDDVSFMRHDRAIMIEFLDKVENFIYMFIHTAEHLEQVAYSKELMKYLINDVNVGMIILDELSRIQDINEFCVRTLSINKSKYIGNHIDTIFYKIDTTANKTSNKVKWGIKNYEYKIKHVLGKDQKPERTIIYLRELSNPVSEKYAQIVIDDIIGDTPAFAEFKQNIMQVAATDATSLLIGETGTGKEMFARIIHRYSARENKPFIVIDCNSTPDSLIESMLFGYEKGAFTGASAGGKTGKFAIADKGTVFLDEVEAIPLHIQTKLLRVLENRSFEKVGGTKETFVDIRIIAATNMDLEALVAAGKFREDLYYRLNVVSLLIPPLRERGEDILVLANHFLEYFSSQKRKKIEGFDKEVERFFLNYDWRGNVRELKNTIEYAVIMESADYIRQCSLPHQMRRISMTKFKTLAELEREQIIKALSMNTDDSNGKSAAAAMLGISRSTLYRKIKEYGITVSGTTL